MSREDKQIDEMREAWSRASDDDVLKAVLKDWDEYSAQAQQIINDELSKRHLDIKVRPISFKPMVPPVSIRMRFARLMPLILSISFIGIVDVGLWYYYECRDRPIIANIDRLKTFLDNEQDWIANTEDTLRYKKAEIEKLSKKTLAQPNEEKSTNTNLLESAIREYDSLYTDFESRLQIYNTKVEEYNSLIDKIGTRSRWYLIPIPYKVKSK